MEGGSGGGGGVSGAHWGSILHIIVIWSFPSRKKEEGCERGIFLFFFFSHSLAQLSCGFAELPRVHTLDAAVLLFV